MVKTGKTGETPRADAPDDHVMFDAYPDAVFVQGPGGQIFHANLAAVQRYGYSLDELLQMKITDLAPPDLKEQAAGHLRQALASGDRFEWRHRRKDGSELPVEIIARPVVHQGQPAILSSVRDVTERKQNETQLRKSEERFSKIFHASPFAMHLFRLADGASVLANHAFLSLIGYSRDELTNSTAAELNLFVDPTARNVWMQELQQSGSTRPRDVQIRQKSGAVRDISATIELIELDGRQLGMVMATDVTERKLAEQGLIESEQRYRLLFENMVSGFLLVEVVQDEQGVPVDLVILACNAAFERATQLKGQNVVGQRLTQVLPSVKAGALDLIALYGQVALSGESRRFELSSARQPGLFYEISAFQAAPRQCAIQFLDITERKRAELALSKSRALLQGITDNTPSLMYALDLEKRFIFANRALSTLFGLESAEFIGKKRGELMPAEMADSHEANDQLVIRSRRPTEFEETASVNGAVVTYLTEKFPLFDPQQGTLWGVGGVSTDISLRKETELALRESEQRLRLTLELSNIGLWDWDMRRDTWYSTPTYFRMLGYDPTVDPQNREVWGERTHPDDREFVVNKMVSVRDGGDSSFDIEFRFRHADGSYRWVNSVGYAIEFDQAGRCTRMLGLQIDINNRREAETQIRKLNAFYQALNQTEKAIVRATDADTLYQQVCEIAVRQINVRLAWVGVPDGDWFRVAASAGPGDGYLAGVRISLRADLPEGQGPSGLVYRSGKRMVCHDFSTDPMTQPWHARAARFGINASAVFPLLRESQVIAVLNIYTGIDALSEDEVELMEALAMDISYALDHLHRQSKLQRALHEVQQANDALESRVRERTAQLERAKESAESADRVKSAFLSTMSHELRTPLNSVIGFTGVLLQGLAGPLNAEQAKQLGIVKRSGQHLLELVNDVLDISKIEAGQLQIPLETVDLPALLQRAAERFRPQAAALGLEFSLAVAPGIGSVVSNQRRLEQVLNNLVSNALKFTDRGQIRLSCQASDTRLRIEVNDTGIGIKAEDIGKLFNPFVQLDSGAGRLSKGTGLGLAISRRIVEFLGGEIDVESRPGVGSCFYFTLPFSRMSK